MPFDYAGHVADRRGLALRGVPGADHGVAHVEARDGVGEVAHEVPPPQLSVRDDLEAQLSLPGQDPQDVLVLQLAQPLGIRRGDESRLQQLGRPQKAPDVVRSIACRHAPVSLAADPAGRFAACW